MRAFDLRWGAVVLALLIVGCSGQKDAGTKLKVSQANELGVLLYNIGAEPRDLDPQTISGVPENHVVRALLEGLVSPGPNNHQSVIAGTAKSWSLAPDKRTWTFHLRPEARWSNGDPVTAQDFIYAWKRALLPALGCEYADWFYMIEGAEAFHLGGGRWEKVGLASPDSHTLVVRLKAPTADFLEILTGHTFLPVHAGNVESAGPADARQTGWTRHLIGNGPFRLVEWRPNVRIRVERNPYYWDAANLKLNGIHFFPIDNETTEVNSFESGTLHLTGAIPVNRIEYYKESAPEKIRFDAFAGVYFYRININRPGLDQASVRHALSMALDRKIITERIRRGGERPAFGYTPDGVGGYATPQSLTYDPARARELMAEAGYPGGKGFPPIELLYNTSDNHRTIAEAVQEMWRQELGIEVTLTNMEWKVYLDTTQSMNFDLARAGWIGNIYPFSFLRNYDTQSPNNETGFSDPVYDELLFKGSHTLDSAERMRLLREAEERLLEALPIIPVFWYNNVYLIHPAVQGWEPKFDDMRPYRFVGLDAAQP